MRATRARAAWAFGTVVWLAASGAMGVIGCQATQDQGAAGTAAPMAGSTGVAGDIPCAAASVIQQHCEKCHGAVLRMGAPMPLLHPADFQAVRNGVALSQSSMARVQDATRPMPPPPDARLSAGDIAALQQWLAGGALPVAGGCAITSAAPIATGGVGGIAPTTTGGAGGISGASGSSGVGETGGMGGSDAGEAGAAGGAPTTGNWAMFGHDLGNSRNNPDETVLSPSSVPGLRRLWMHDGAGTTSAPVIVDGVVYLPMWDGSVNALRVADGSEVWTARLPDLIDSSAAVTATRVYVGDDAGSVHALDRATGAELWVKRVDAHAESHLWSSPIPIEEENLIVIGVASGEEALPAPHTFRGSVVGLDADDGDIRWQFYTTADDASSGPGIAVWGTPTVDTVRKLVYIGTGNNYEMPAGQYADAMLAIDYQTGMLAWSNQFTPNDIFVVGAGATGPDYDIGSTANLFSAGGKDLVGIGVKNGIYYALDRDTGITQWMAMITEGGVLGGVISASAYADGTVYVASNRFMMGATRTVALDAATGMVRWEHSAEMITYGGVAQANGVTYVGSTSGTIFALDSATGAVLWSDMLPDAIAGSPTVAGGVLYVPWGYQWTLRQGEPAVGGLVAYGL